MPKNIVSEQDALDEFNSRLEGETQTSPSDGEDTPKEKPKRQQPTNRKEAALFDESTQRMERNLTRGSWVNVPLDELPSMGRFYPEDTVINIKPATVAEIRDYSQIDVSNAKDVMDRLNNIVSKCAQIIVNGKQQSYKSILECDKMMLIFHIRCATFTDGLSVINIPIPKGTCPNPSCDGPKEIKLDLNMIGFKGHDDDSIIAKYYDEKQKAFVVRTKRYGSFALYPPTIGSTQFVMNWMTNNQDKTWDKTVVPMLAYLMNPTHIYTDNMFWNMIVNSNGWDTTKFTLIYRCIEAIESEVGISTDLNVICDKCGEEMKVPFGFSFDIKQLFVESLQDIASELD